MSEYLDALRRERDGYLAAGRTDRAAEVDAEIARVTGAADKRAEAVQPTEAPTPTKRTTSRKAKA